MSKSEQQLPIMLPTHQPSGPSTSWSKTLGPYAELMRLHKPAAILIIYWPYLFGSLLAALFRPDHVNDQSLAVSCATMFVAAFFLRSWGCTWNDIVDRDVDRHVARTAQRPMARGAVSVRNASLFCILQAALWLGIVYVARPAATSYAVVVSVLTLIYPFAKRFTDFPQIHLGLTFSLGTLVSASSLGLDFHELFFSHPNETATLTLAMLAYVVWTMLADTIYAFQDVKDDVEAGVKSMAVRFEESPHTLFGILAILQVGVLVGMGVSMKAHIPYYISACGGNSMMLGFLLQSVNVERPSECMWWFEKGSFVFGAVTSLGLLSEYWVLRLAV